MRAKAGGALLLDQRSRDIDLDFFTLFSSTTSLWGVSGLAHYAAANQVLDALAHSRWRTGLPAMNINWGTWDEMRVASLKDRQYFQQVGLKPIQTARCLEVLEQVLRWKDPQICVADVNWPRFRGVYEARKIRPLFERMVDVERLSRPITSDETQSLKQILKDIPKTTGPMF